MRRALLAASRAGAPAAARAFRTSAPQRITYDEWIFAKPHCHHQALWKEFKPLGPAGNLLSGDYEWAGNLVGLEKNEDVVKDLTDMCHYYAQVLATMPDSEYKTVMTERTKYKLSVLESGKSQDEMKEAFGFGELEELHASVRGELELLKTLGKDFFSSAQ